MLTPNSKAAHAWLARRLSGMPIDNPSDDEMKAWDSLDAAIVRRVIGSNGEGPMGAFNAALVEYVSDETQRAQYSLSVLGHDSTPQYPEADAPASNGVEPETRFKVYTAQDAMQPQPPVDWVIGDLFSAGSVSVVFGEGGSKKTWTLLDAAVAVAQGAGEWLGLTVKQGPVLIVDEESGPRRLARRIQEVIIGHGADGSIPFFYTCLSQTNLRDPDDVAQFRALIVETGARLVVIDALADVMPGGDENAVKDVQPLFLAVRKIAEETQAAIVIIHHSGKAGTYRGSSAIKGAVDLLLMVASKSASKQIDFTFEKARDVEPFEFSATANFEPGKFWLSSADKKAHVPKLGKPKKYVLQWLSKHGKSTIEDIKSHADTCSSESAQRAVFGLASDGLIKRADGGGPGTKAEYNVTASGMDAIKPANL